MTRGKVQHNENCRTKTRLEAGYDFKKRGQSSRRRTNCDQFAAPRPRGAPLSFLDDQGAPISNSSPRCGLRKALILKSVSAGITAPGMA